jgi:hypothetical protein
VTPHFTFDEHVLGGNVCRYDTLHVTVQVSVYSSESRLITGNVTSE